MLSPMSVETQTLSLSHLCMDSDESSLLALEVDTGVLSYPGGNNPTSKGNPRSVIPKEALTGSEDSSRIKTQTMGGKFHS